MNRLPQGLSTIFGMLPQRTEQRVVEPREKKNLKKIRSSTTLYYHFYFLLRELGHGVSSARDGPVSLLLCFFLPFIFTIFHASIVRRSSDSKLPRLLVVFLFPFQNVTLTR